MKITSWTFKIIIAFNLSLFAANIISAENTEGGQDVFAGFYRLQQIDIQSDPALMKIMHHIERNKGPISIWQGKNSSLLYIVDLVDQSLTIMDAKNQPSLEKPIPIKVGRGAISVIANNDDSVAFVTNLFDGTLSVVDVKRRKVSGTLKLKVDSQPYCQIFGADESRLYVVTRRGDSVFVIDPMARNVIDTLSVKDLARDVQLKHCYGSCHKDKRRIMQESFNRKPTIPSNTLTVPEAKLVNNGLRTDHQRRFLIHYSDYLAKQDAKNSQKQQEINKEYIIIEAETDDGKLFSDGLTIPDKMSMSEWMRKAS